MAQAIRPSPVKLIVGAIFSGEGILIRAQKGLIRKFGPIDYRSPVIAFNFTDYYKKEMGRGLKRQFFSFQRLIASEKLAEIKLYTNRLERRFSRVGPRPARRINLDPGYISDAKLVLASCKNFAHRIYLRKGVFAEVTLHFRNKTFRSWPWTFPDYRTSDYRRCLNAVRQIYLKQLRG